MERGPRSRNLQAQRATHAVIGPPQQAGSPVPDCSQAYAASRESITASRPMGRISALDPAYWGTPVRDSGTRKLGRYAGRWSLARSGDAGASVGDMSAVPVQFLQMSYEAAAERATWGRTRLERRI